MASARRVCWRIASKPSLKSTGNQAAALKQISKSKSVWNTYFEKIGTLRGRSFRVSRFSISVSCKSFLRSQPNRPPPSHCPKKMLLCPIFRAFCPFLHLVSHSNNSALLRCPFWVRIFSLTFPKIYLHQASFIFWGELKWNSLIFTHHRTLNHSLLTTSKISLNRWEPPSEFWALIPIFI